MGLGTVPENGEYCIDGLWTPGRQVREQSARRPVAWITDRACHSPGLDWVTLGRQSSRTGLQPFLLSGLDDRGTMRPWDNGEFSEPEDTSRIDGINVAQLLEGWWDGQVPDENEDEEDEELQAMLAPFGVRFPGLAHPIDEPLGAELMRRALRQYTRAARHWSLRRRSGPGRTGSAPACLRSDSPTSASWSAGRRRPWRPPRRSPPSTARSATRAPGWACGGSAKSRPRWSATHSETSGGTSHATPDHDPGQFTGLCGRD